MGGTIIRTSPVQINIPKASDMPQVITPELKAAMERAAAQHADRSNKRRSEEAQAKMKRAQQRLRAAERTRDLAAYKVLLANSSRARWTMSPDTLRSGISLTFRLKSLLPDREMHLRSLRDRLQQELDRQCRMQGDQSRKLQQEAPQAVTLPQPDMKGLLSMLVAKYAKPQSGR